MTVNKNLFTKDLHRCRYGTQSITRSRKQPAKAVLL